MSTGSHTRVPSGPLNSDVELVGLADQREAGPERRMFGQHDLAGGGVDLQGAGRRSFRNVSCADLNARAFDAPPSHAR